MFRLKRGLNLFAIRKWYSNFIKGSLDNKSIEFSTGKYGRLADGATVVQCGDTSVMVTAVSKSILSSSSFLPLTVDYRERGSAVGRIPHNFLRRELRSSDREIVISRFIDRSIRPLFPDGYFYETQVICNLLAVDSINDPDVLCINGASASLSISDIPWNGPIAAVRIGICNGQLIVNPSRKQLSSCQFNIVLSCTNKAIVMLEGFGSEITEEKFCEAVKFGFDQAQSLIEIIKKFQELIKNPIRDYSCVRPSSELQETAEKFCTDKIWGILRNVSHKKMSRDKELFKLCDELKDKIKLMEENIDTFLVEQSFWKCVKQVMNKLVLDENVRCDGRGLYDTRPIECEVDLFKPLHGSARFLRGETQVVSTITFDSIESAAKADSISQAIGGQRSRNFMLHYEFPPFANNVTGHYLMNSRREIGHSTLAERGIQTLIPTEFPFTIRVNSQVTDSNGSSSMATVCSSSLALFDSGISMSKSVAGVACGLMLEFEHESQDIKRYQIISDLSGIEDATGHMDFKIAGTRDGITSCQVDIKDCHGLPFEIIEEAVNISRRSRHAVLDIMNNCLDKPRATLKSNTPVYENIEIPLSKRYKVLGTGGHRIRNLIEETGAQLTTIDDEIMSIFAPSRSIMYEVQERINSLLNAPDNEESTLELGAIYTARVIDIKPFGLLMELEPSGIKSLLHCSQIDHKHIVHPDELGFQLGQTMSVKYFGRDPAGRLRISRKALLKNPYKKQNPSNSSITNSIKTIINAKEEK